MNVGKDDEIAQQAAAVRARIVGGEDFAKVADRSLGRGVEGQRRLDWSDQRRRSLTRAPAADSEDEAGRRDRAAAGAARASSCSSSKR